LFSVTCLSIGLNMLKRLDLSIDLDEFKFVWMCE